VITPKFVPAPRTDPDVVPTNYTQPNPILPIVAQRVPAEERLETNVRTELPGPQRLFLRESEAQFFDRLAQEMKRQGGTRAIFPETPVLSKEPYQPRCFPHMVELVEPSYLCHHRLYFEQPNFERYGYNYRMLQPAIELGVFYYDLILWPYHASSDLCNRYECTTEKCLPGDPAPLRVPCERFSVTGLIGQSAAIIGGLYMFPR
jgi:hypothetical protein